MPREIYPSSYECDCGHQLHFFENTIREIKDLSYRKRAGVGEGGNRHTVLFHKGQMVAIFCPKLDAGIPAMPDDPPPPKPRRLKPPRPAFTLRQGQILSFIHHYTKLNRVPPAEADIAWYFHITSPSAHGMLVTLTWQGLIDREPGAARSIALRIDPETLPPLE